MKIIDGHMHVRGVPGDWFKQCAKKRGYSAYTVASLSCMQEFGGAVNNEQCLEVKRRDPLHAYFFAALEHPCEDYRAHVEKWIQKGADGLKLIETKPTVYNETHVDLSDDKFDAMFAYLEEHAIPVLWHVGDPATFWDPAKAPPIAFEKGWFYGSGEFPTLQECYAMAEKVLERHPKLNVCFAHLYFCGDDRAHADRMMETYENFHLDLTPGSEMYGCFREDPEGWRAFFLRWQDRIHLGTDTVNGENIDGHTAFELVMSALTAGPVYYYEETWEKGLNLPDEVIQKIIYDNFRAFVGGAPKPLG